MPSSIDLTLDDKTFALLGNILAGERHDLVETAQRFGLGRDAAVRAFLRMLPAASANVDTRAVQLELNVGPKELLPIAIDMQAWTAISMLFQREPDVFEPYREWLSWEKREDLETAAVGAAVPDFLATDPPRYEEVPLAAKRLGRRFMMKRQLAKGGQAYVWAAMDEALNTPVALKIQRDVRVHRFTQSFQHEAEIHVGMRHANIVPLLASGFDDRRGYLVLPLCSGDFSVGKEKKGLPPYRVAEVVRRIALALSFVHRRGVLHLDVKPHNILMTWQGEPLLSDFGLALRRTESCGDQFGGTPAYMSPEQLAGKVLDERADIYGLGVTLYQLLSGELPFEAAGDGLEKVHRLRELVLSKPPQPPRAYDSTIPGELEAICLRAMAPEPQARYQTAEEMARALRRWQYRTLRPLTDWWKGLWHSAPPPPARTGDAIETNERSLVQSRASGDRLAQATALENLGIALSIGGNRQAAVSQFEEALSIRRTLYDPLSLADTHWSFCQTLRSLGENRKAVEHALESLQIYTRLNHPMEAMVRRQIAAWAED